MATAPLLEGEATPGGTVRAHSLSIKSITALKRKVRNWRAISHEHALDHAMFMGSKTITKNGHYESSQRKAEMHKAGTLKEEDHAAEEEGLQTNSDAITNLLNNSLGAGIVCLPNMVANLGLPLGIFTLLVSAVLNRNQLLLILRCCEIAGIETSYNTLAKTCYGNFGRGMVIFVFVCMGFGSLLCYVVATSDSANGLLKVCGVEMDETLVLYLGAFLLFPPTYIRRLTGVATLSLVAFVGAIVVVFCVLVFCGMHFIQNGFPSSGDIRWVPDGFAPVIGFVPTGICVMAIQAGGSIICASLKDGSPQNRVKVTGIAYGICFAIFNSVAVPAYLVFLSETKGDVLMSFPKTHPLTIMAKIAILDLVVLSYMFMMIPCRVALIQLFFDKNEVKLEATNAQFAIVTTGVNVTAMVLASLIPDLAFATGIISCVAANLVALILPSLLYVKVLANPKIEGMVPRPVGSPKNLPWYLLTVLAMCSTCAGLYVLIKKKMEE